MYREPATKAMPLMEAVMVAVEMGPLAAAVQPAGARAFRVVTKQPPGEAVSVGEGLGEAAAVGEAEGEAPGESDGVGDALGDRLTHWYTRTRKLLASVRYSAPPALAGAMVSPRTLLKLAVSAGPLTDPAEFAPGPVPPASVITLAAPPLPSCTERRVFVEASVKKALPGSEPAATAKGELSSAALPAPSRCPASPLPATVSTLPSAVPTVRKRLPVLSATSRRAMPGRSARPRGLLNTAARPRPSFQPDSDTLPARVLTMPPATMRTAWPSVTHTLAPPALQAMPERDVKVAVMAAPSLLPRAPLPASVLTPPVGDTARMR